MNRYFLFLCSILLSLTNNCLVIASFDPKIKEVEFKQEGIGSKTIVVSLTQKNTANRHSRGMLSISSQTGDTLLKACKESSLFKEVFSGNESADLKLHVESELNFGLIPTLLFLSAVTLTIIPNYETHDRKIIYSFFDDKGKLLKSYRRRAHDIQLFHILFLPFMFFRYNVTGNHAILEDITKSVLDEANRDGLFK
jgi:hypothetical protein